MKSIDFTRGLWMLYLAFRGMSLLEIGALEGIFHITSLLMEVPTGAVADLMGRKLSRVMGMIISLCSLFILMFSDSFWLFALSFVFSALSYNLDSGSGEALVYDSMKSLGEEKGYTKVLGRNEAIFNIASILSLFIGGMLGEESFMLAYTCSAVVGIISLIISTTFYEPPIEKIVNSEHSLKNFFIHTYKSFKTLFSNGEVAFLTVFTTIFSAFATVIFFYIQNYWRSEGISVSQVGIFLAIGSGVCALSTINMERIESFLRKRKWSVISEYPFLFFGLMIFSGIFGLAILGIFRNITLLSLIFLVFTMVGESGMYVMFNSFLNKHIPSHQRATIISIDSMLFSISMIGVFPFFGWIADAFSFYHAFIVLIFISLALLIPSGFIIRKFLRKRVVNV
jgi:MFS family permease